MFKSWSIDVTPEMSPSARLIAYYIDKNERVVADSLLLKIEDKLPTEVTANNKRLKIGHVRFINILAWLRGFQVKLLYLVLFSMYPSLFWELRDKRDLKNLQFDPKTSGPC